MCVCLIGGEIMPNMKNAEKRVLVNIKKEKANNDYQKACDASNAETKDQEKAIKLWGEILGGDFPSYG